MLYSVFKVKILYFFINILYISLLLLLLLLSLF